MAIVLCDVSVSLPEDMVGEILSWLPVESLHRFKCVCKNWYQLIQQNDLVEKHHRRAAMWFYYHKIFSCIDIQKGLLLEHLPTERLRIRNPATRQTVYLPELRVGNKPLTWAVARMFFIAKTSNECTVISFSESEESNLFGRFRALTIGVDAAWRPLKNSPPNSIHFCISNSRKPQIYALSIKKIFHVVIMDKKKILSVDAEEESIKTAKIPENLSSFVTPIEWNSKLALCCDEGDGFYFWVLMNYNNEWAKTQTVHLATFTQDYPISYIKEEDKIMAEKLSIKPTVLQLKGMQSENVEEETKDAHFWKEIDIPTTSPQIISLISLELSRFLAGKFQKIKYKIQHEL